MEERKNARERPVTGARQGMGDAGAGRLIAERFRLVRQLGAGGMGRVWLAYDEHLRCQVSLKEIAMPMASNDGREHAIRIARARAEARHAARLRGHPHVVTVLDVFDYDDLPWIVMEFVADATDVHTVVKEGGPLPPAETARIGLAVLDALTTGHRLGILHRDVKPANILLASDASGHLARRVLLTDYGIALQPASADPRFTETRGVVGTPGYLAPERLRGEGPTPAGDLFSLGATLYYAVEGRSPFDAVAPYGALVSEPRVPVRAEGLASILLNLLVKDPVYRAAPEEVAQALSAVLDEAPGPKAGAHLRPVQQPPTSAPAPGAPTLSSSAVPMPSGGVPEPRMTSSVAVSGAVPYSPRVPSPAVPAEPESPPAVRQPPAPSQTDARTSPPWRSLVDRLWHTVGAFVSRRKPLALTVAGVLAVSAVWGGLQLFGKGDDPGTRVKAQQPKDPWRPASGADSHLPYGQDVGLGRQLSAGDCVIAVWVGERFKSPPRLAIQDCATEWPDAQVVALQPGKSLNDLADNGANRCAERTKSLVSTLPDAIAFALTPKTGGWNGNAHSSVCMLFSRSEAGVGGPLGKFRRLGDVLYAMNTATGDCTDQREDKDKTLQQFLADCKDPHVAQVVGFVHIPSSMTHDKAKDESYKLCQQKFTARWVPDKSYDFNAWTPGIDTFNKGFRYIQCSLVRVDRTLQDKVSPVAD